jgi:hypothetical protein
VRPLARNAAWIALVAVLGCSRGHRDSHRETSKEPPRERARRIVEPSTERVGPLPPYAIRADGVGPYKLGEKLSDLLAQLAHGPRIALFEIPGLVHRDVIRAEDDAILVGGEQASTASFVAVVGADVAVVGPEVTRSDARIHVGSTRDELIAALGPSVEDPERVRDPRLVVPGALPNLRAVIEAGKVVAFVVATGAAPLRHSSECDRPQATDRAVGACLTHGGELVQVEGEEIAVRSADGDRAIAPPIKLPGLVFAAPLRSGDKDELVVITRNDEPTARSWWLAAYRLDGSRLVRSIEPTQLYQLSRTNVRWIGAPDVRDVDLYLELTSRPDTIEVGGLLTTLVPSRGAPTIRDVVVISTTSAPRRRAKPAAADASTAAGSAAAASAGSAGK